MRFFNITWIDDSGQRQPTERWMGTDSVDAFNRATSHAIESRRPWLVMSSTRLHTATVTITAEVIEVDPTTNEPIKEAQ